jgi:DNA-binding NtrC family response regulator
MFGHVQGAFTDARGSAGGFVEAADGGTLFLDEISELSPAAQATLLVVLEDGCFRRLGSPREVQVDIRVISATNADIEARIASGEFRSDLFFRLAALSVRIPPLRSRNGAFPALVRALLGSAGREITPEAVELLRRRRWPGNLRQLQSVLEAASLLAGDGPIGPEHLSDDFCPGGPAEEEAGRRYARWCDARHESEMIASTLRQTGGNRTRAARLLGMGRTTLWTKIHRYGLNGDEGPRGAGEAEPTLEG